MESDKIMGIKSYQSSLPRHWYRDACVWSEVWLMFRPMIKGDIDIKVASHEISLYKVLPEGKYIFSSILT